jgi:hypothetical protein
VATDTWLQCPIARHIDEGLCALLRVCRETVVRLQKTESLVHPLVNVSDNDDSKSLVASMSCDWSRRFQGFDPDGIDRGFLSASSVAYL